MSRKSIFISHWTQAVKTMGNCSIPLSRTVKTGYRHGTGHFQSYVFIPLVVWYQILHLTGTLGALLPWRRTVSDVRHGKISKGNVVTLETATWVSWSLQGRKKRNKDIQQDRDSMMAFITIISNVSTNHLVDEEEWIVGFCPEILEMNVVTRCCRQQKKFGVEV